MIERHNSIHLAIDAVGARYGGSATELLDILQTVIDDLRIDRVTLFCSPPEKRIFDLPIATKLFESPQNLVDRNYPIRLLWYERLLGTECKKIGADILFIASNFGRAGFDIPHVTYVQQSLPFSQEAMNTLPTKDRFINRVRRTVMRRSCRKASRVICQSSTMQNWLIEAFQLDPARLTTIYTVPKSLPVYNRSKSLSGEENIATEITGRLLYVGVEYPYKKLETLVSGFDLIRRRFSNAILRLTLPPDHPYSVKPGVECLGYLNDEQLSDAYQGSDILVLPSLVESGPQSPIEAMSLGTPVLVANRPYAHDICEDAALFFDPLSPEDLAEKAIKLLTDQTLRKTLIERGYALIEKRRAEKPYQKIVDILVDIATSSRNKQTPNYS